tara:strand:+ start:419 stop:2098 length:1680 start_codon:yes stop_codon:yes gene_type:complete
VKKKKKILLEINNLTLSHATKSGLKDLLKNISFTINTNEIVALIGESGSGKSLTSLSILGLLDKKKFNSSGRIRFEKQNILNLHEKGMMKIRGSEISMIFQEPMTALNPSMKIGRQILELFSANKEINENKFSERIKSLIKKVKLDGVRNLFDKYPHEISGGQKQRVMIVMALASSPKLLIADEPTTALDVTTQKEIIEILKSLQKSEDLSILFICHDLKLVSKFSDKIIIIRKGSIIEKGGNKQIFRNPKNEYTKALLSLIINDKKRLIKLPTIENFLGDFKEQSQSIKKRKERFKIIYSKKPILEIKDLTKYYSTAKNIFVKNKDFKALDNVNINLYKGETLGIIGESGSGKTSLSNIILKVHDFEIGEILFNGRDITKLTKQEMLDYRKKVQIVFQDPYASLNPLQKVIEIISEPILFHKICSKKLIYKKSLEIIKDVGLDETFLQRYPHELSGGQRQRVCLARAIAISPKILICDECVSALDVSVQATILNLLNELKEKYSLTYIFISHDLSVVKYMSDKIVVLFNGRVVEYNDADIIFKEPKEDYTKKLIKFSF